MFMEINMSGSAKWVQCNVLNVKYTTQHSNEGQLEGYKKSHNVILFMRAAHNKVHFDSSPSRQISPWTLMGDIGWKTSIKVHHLQLFIQHRDEHAFPWIIITELHYCHRLSIPRKHSHFLISDESSTLRFGVMHCMNLLCQRIKCAALWGRIWHLNFSVTCYFANCFIYNTYHKLIKYDVLLQTKLNK